MQLAISIRKYYVNYLKIRRLSINSKTVNSKVCIKATKCRVLRQFARLICLHLDVNGLLGLGSQFQISLLQMTGDLFGCPDPRKHLWCRMVVYA